MDDTRIPKMVYEWELEERKRRRVRQPMSINRAYITLCGTLTSQQRKLKVEIDGGLSLMEEEIECFWVDKNLCSNENSLRFFH